MIKINNAYKVIISILMSLMLSFLCFGCKSENTGQSSSHENPTNPNTPSQVVEINDSFVKLQITDLAAQGVNVLDLLIDEIKVDPTLITKIEIQDIEVVTINDSFVYLSYQNFINYYGDDSVDWGEFLKDVAIGATVIIVCVSLSTIGGPVGTFFGSVICSQFTAAAICVGAALDAAIAGYQAYKEGGSTEKIFSRMLNGVADGFKWGPILAPVSGAISGIKAARAVRKLSKIEGLDKFTNEQLTDITKDMSNIIKNSTKLNENSSEMIIRQTYREVKSNLSNKITEDMFVAAIRNKSTLINVVKESNISDASSKLVKELKKDYFRKANISDENINSIIKGIQNKTLKSVNDFEPYGLKNYINTNFKEFVELFGKSIDNSFLDNSLIDMIGESAYGVIKSKIGRTDNLYGELIAAGEKFNIDNVINDTTFLIMMQQRFGVEKMQNLISSANLYRQLLSSNIISDEAIKTIIDELLDGTIKTVDTINKINPQITRNMANSLEVINMEFKQLGISKQSTKIINDLINIRLLSHLKKDIINEKILKDILENNLTKERIINTYGNNVYNELLDKAEYVISLLGEQSTLNKKLINSIFTDKMLQSSLSNDHITNIQKGLLLKDWELPNDKILEIGNIIAEYYRVTDYKTYCNFVDEFTEIRCQIAKEWNNSRNQIPINGQYASKICPCSNDYIKEKYGDIYYNSAGYPIFDKFAIARIESSQLNGANGGKIDIDLANRMHHGNQVQVPGYTWHHLEDGKTLILIPSELHNAAISGYKHWGGAKLLRDGCFGER